MNAREILKDRQGIVRSIAPDATVFEAVVLSLGNDFYKAALNDLDPEAHLAVGRALAPLRDEGVLIIGSGNTYHNMGKMMRAMRGGPDGPVNGGDFDRWLTGAVTHEDPGARRAMLAAWDRAPGARDANPREEHLIPLHVVAGAALADRGEKTLEDHVLGAVESAFRFG